MLSLREICHLEIRNGVENGIMPAQLLPPAQRQLVLETVLMRGTINEPGSLAILSSKEFLTDLTVFNTQSGIEDDHEYLDRVANSMAAIAPNGEKIGSSISELRLNIYFRYRKLKEGSEALDFQNVFRLIGECPRLTKLDLRVVTFDKRQDDDGMMGEEHNDWYLESPGFLNELQLHPCLSVVENLEEFVFIGKFKTPILLPNQPFPKFKRLSALHLESCLFDYDVWYEILYQLRETLTSLKVENVKTDLYRCSYNRSILPFPLSNLKSLHLKGCEWGEYYKLPTFILMECPQLENVSLGITPGIVDDGELAEVADINAALEITLDLSGKFGHCSELNLISKLGEKVKCFKYTERGHSEISATAILREMVDKCHDLVEFEFYSSRNQSEAKLILAPLFANEERAWKLRKLVLCGDYDENILKSIAENCVNVEWFSIKDCRQLSDNHLIEWAHRGVRLSTFHIRRCSSVTDDGMIAILMSSGAKLSEFAIMGYDHCRVTGRTFCALIEFCRYVKWGLPITENLEYYADYADTADITKCFAKSLPLSYKYNNQDPIIRMFDDF